MNSLVVYKLAHFLLYTLQLFVCILQLLVELSSYRLLLQLQRHITSQWSDCLWCTQGFAALHQTRMTTIAAPAISVASCKTRNGDSQMRISLPGM